MEHRASIIVPLLTQVDAWLYQCIFSALSQTVPCEVLVITAPETPESNRLLLHHLQQMRRDMRVAVQQAPGFAAAINSGINLACCERVGFLLSDDWLDPTAIEATLAHDADIVSTGMKLYLADGQTPLPISPRALRTDDFLRLPDHEAQARYLTHFFLFRRNMIEKVGGLDETIGDTPGVDDYDFIWTLLANNATVSIVESPKYNYRDHNKDRLTLRSVDEMTNTMNNILVKHGITGKLKDDLLAQKAQWFGRPIRDVLVDLMTDPDG